MREKLATVNSRFQSAQAILPIAVECGAKRERNPEQGAAPVTFRDAARDEIWTGDQDLAIEVN